MDPDEVIPTDHCQRPELPPIQTSEYTHMSFAQAALMRQQQQGNQRYLHTTPPLSSTGMTPTGPLVNVLPPTPIPPPRSSYVDAEPGFTPPTRPVTPVSNCPMAMSSPTASFLNTNSPRKQRFTMGPRTDCEKCRLGVKGHWVHY
jgi:hypothetical protein